MVITLVSDCYFYISSRLILWILLIRQKVLGVRQGPLVCSLVSFGEVK